MRTINGEKEVMASLTTLEIENMIGNGQIYGGMIPKVRAAIQCIQGKVEEVLIVNGAEPAVLSRVLSGEPLGTRIIR
jgi:acetylglutamate kinase